MKRLLWGKSFSPPNIPGDYSLKNIKGLKETPFGGIYPKVPKKR